MAFLITLQVREKGSKLGHRTVLSVPHGRSSGMKTTLPVAPGLALFLLLPASAAALLIHSSRELDWCHFRSRDHSLERRSPCCRLKEKDSVHPVHDSLSPPLAPLCPRRGAKRRPGPQLRLLGHFVNFGAGAEWREIKANTKLRQKIISIMAEMDVGVVSACCPESTERKKPPFQTRRDKLDHRY